MQSPDGQPSSPSFTYNFDRDSDSVCTSDRELEKDVETGYDPHSKYGPRPFSVVLFAVEGYSRRFLSMQIPSDIKHIIFGYSHCPHVSRYILEANIDDSTPIDHQSLHQTICNQIVDDFNNASNTLFKEEETAHCQAVITQIITDCSEIVIHNGKERNKEHPLFDPTVQFIQSLLSSVTNRGREYGFFPMANHIIQQIANIQRRFVQWTPKPKELLQENEPFGIVTRRFHNIITMITDWPIPIGVTCQYIVNEAEEYLFMMRRMSNLGHRDPRHFRAMHSLAWATAIVGEQMGDEHSRERVRWTSEMLQHLFACIRLGSSTKRDRKDFLRDIIHIPHKCPSILESEEIMQRFYNSNNSQLISKMKKLRTA